MKLLIVEDNEAVARMLTRGLTTEGYVTEVAADGAEAYDLARGNAYAAIILDIMLPKMDGFTVCRRLREDGNRTPIMMLTARDGLSDKVNGLDLGADDYLPKPFEFPELAARIRALLRRDKVHKLRVIKVADLIIDTASHTVCRAGEFISLSSREYDLLEALAANEGRVLARQTIQDRIWQDDGSYSNTVDVYINMLRKKIDAGHEVKLIQTVRGAGYMLRPERPLSERA